MTEDGLPRVRVQKKRRESRRGRVIVVARA